jgi:hypothetical protein
VSDLIGYPAHFGPEADTTPVGGERTSYTFTNPTTITTGNTTDALSVGGERMSEERPEAYSIGFDEGNGDEACFTLFHDGEVQIYAYGKTARLLHDAFTAYATSLERKPEYDGRPIANPIEFSDLLAREFIHEGDMRSFRASQTDSEKAYIRLWAYALEADLAKRKPLDGYDWRADLEFLDGAADTEDTQYEETIRLAAYIESLEADMDALVEGLRTVITHHESINARIRRPRDESRTIAICEAAIARVKGRAK